MGNLPREPVAWATVNPVPQSGRVWVDLSELTAVGIAPGPSHAIGYADPATTPQDSAPARRTGEVDPVVDL